MLLPYKITKITYREDSYNRSHTETGTPDYYNNNDFNNLMKSIRDTAKYRLSIADAVEAMLAVPDCNIGECIKLITGITPHIQERTKKTRTYQIPGLLVWVEDIQPETPQA